MNKSITICASEGCDNATHVGTRGRPLKYCSTDCRLAQEKRNKAAKAQQSPYRAKDGNKLCGECGEVKPTSEYHNDKKRADGLYPWCKDCRRIYMGSQRRQRAEISKQEYDRKRREKLKQELGEPAYKHKSRDYYLKGRYGIGVNGYNAILAQQDGKCAICRTDMLESTITNGDGTRKYYAVDHDHSCCPGETSCGDCVRGILCHTCNVALGCFKDDPDIMRAAIQYVMTPVALKIA